jgi:hypothetical protein
VVGAADDEHDPWFSDSAAAVDNQGGRYGFFSSVGGDGEDWWGELEMDPVPRPGVKWLDLTLVPGTAPVRINLDQFAPPEPAVEPLPRSELAELYVDKVAERLLANRQWQARQMTDGVMALLGAGLIAPDNPAIARLGTLARRLGVALRPDLANGPDTSLPDRWLSVLKLADAMDGPIGIAPVAAVLPEFDGCRWVIAGLRSTSDAADLQVFGWGSGVGWHDASRLFITPGKFGWWARDNTGRWHIGSEEGGHWNQRHRDFTLRLTPALHPAATSIDVVLTGKSGRVTVTLPLDWRAGT